ncbi:hypothetical protein GGF50DRAFT_110010 [Schizophyllum commune]
MPSRKTDTGAQAAPVHISREAFIADALNLIQAAREVLGELSPQQQVFYAQRLRNAERELNSWYMQGWRSTVEMLPFGTAWIQHILNHAQRTASEVLPPPPPPSGSSPDSMPAPILSFQGMQQIFDGPGSSSGAGTALSSGSGAHTLAPARSFHGHPATGLAPPQLSLASTSYTDLRHGHSTFPRGHSASYNTGSGTPAIQRSASSSSYYSVGPAALSPQFGDGNQPGPSSSTPGMPSTSGAYHPAHIAEGGQHARTPSQGSAGSQPHLWQHPSALTSDPRPSLDSHFSSEEAVASEQSSHHGHSSQPHRRSRGSSQPQPPKGSRGH